MQLAGRKVQQCVKRHSKPLTYLTIVIPSLAVAFLVFSIVQKVRTHSSRVTWNVDDAQEMEMLLKERLPIGSSIAAARRFMEAEGFECDDVSRGTFVEKSWWGADTPQHEDITFVSCRRVQSLDFSDSGVDALVMSHHWEIALVHDGDAVTAVLVSHYVDGP